MLFAFQFNVRFSFFYFICTKRPNKQIRRFWYLDGIECLNIPPPIDSQTRKSNWTMPIECKIQIFPSTMGGKNIVHETAHCVVMIFNILRYVSKVDVNVNRTSITNRIMWILNLFWEGKWQLLAQINADDVT